MGNQGYSVGNWDQPPPEPQEINIPQDLLKAVSSYQQALDELGDSCEALETARTNHSKAQDRLTSLQERISALLQAMQQRAPRGTAWAEGPKGPDWIDGLSNAEIIKRLHEMQPKEIR